MTPPSSFPSVNRQCSGVLRVILGQRIMGFESGMQEPEQEVLLNERSRQIKTIGTRLLNPAPQWQETRRPQAPTEAKGDFLSEHKNNVH